jgi:hypothetical protein
LLYSIDFSVLASIILSLIYHSLFLLITFTLPGVLIVGFPFPNSFISVPRLKVCLNDSALVNGFGISCGVDRQHDWYDD